MPNAGGFSFAVGVKEVKAQYEITIMNKCIVADDHPLYRSAITQVLRSQYENLEILEASDILSLQQVLNINQDAELVLLDLHMPGTYGFGALAFVHGLCPNIPVLVVSANEKPEIMQKAMLYGARGFLPKSSNLPTIQEAIAQINAGGKWLPEGIKFNTSTPKLEDEEQKIMASISTLTPQQYLVLTMLAQGLLNKQIAYELDVTEATVKAHLTAIFRKLNVRSRTQAVLAVSALHLDSPQSIEADN